MSIPESVSVPPAMNVPHPGSAPVDMGEALRQLELAIHDARVAFDCINLGELERAQEYTITARAATDAAETVLRVALGLPPHVPGEF